MLVNTPVYLNCTQIVCVARPPSKSCWQKYSFRQLKSSCLIIFGDLYLSVWSENPYSNWLNYSLGCWITPFLVLEWIEYHWFSFLIVLFCLVEDGQYYLDTPGTSSNPPSFRVKNSKALKNTDSGIIFWYQTSTFWQTTKTLQTTDLIRQKSYCLVLNINYL